MSDPTPDATATTDALGHALAYLLAVSQARRGAVLAIVDRAPQLIDTQHLNHDALDRLSAIVRFSPTDVVEPSGDQRHLYLPFEACGRPYAFFLDEPKRPIRSPGTFLLHVAQTLGEQASPSQAKSAEVERAEFLALLEREEWNLSRVARRLSCCRPTVYRMLTRLGIERPDSE
jgi:DNA-binding NtrC family response regulator